MHNDDFDLLDSGEHIDSPLDAIAPVDSQPELLADEGERATMLALLRDSEPSQRMLAARTFCEVTEARAITPLIELLCDHCPLVRVSAAYALGRNTSPDAVLPLIETLTNDWNGYVRKGVVWALGNCGDRRTLAPLLFALRQDIPAVRLWAASSLAQVSHLEQADIVAAAPPLIEALQQDSVAAVRSNCAWALGQLCRELTSDAVYTTAIDALMERLEMDSDFGVKADAKDALLRVGDPRGLQRIEELELEGLL